MLPYDFPFNIYLIYYSTVRGHGYWWQIDKTTS